MRIGAAPAAQSYLDVAAIIAAAQGDGRRGDPSRATASSARTPASPRPARPPGIVFIGPTPDNIRAFGLKHTARDLAREHGVPLVPGTELLADVEAARAAAERDRLPGDAQGHRRRRRHRHARLRGRSGSCAKPSPPSRAWPAATSATPACSWSASCAHARHVEVQIFGDGAGRVVALGERDCSLQRRNQKVIEETPAPHLPRRCARRCLRRPPCAWDRPSTTGRRARSSSSSTPARDEFFFLEVNTRLQVEHGVTEEVTGVDLVEWMIRGAAGELAFLDGLGQPSPRSARSRRASTPRIPTQDYRPSSGRLTEVRLPDTASRVETWVAAGNEVSAWYDPLLAKLIVTAPDRDDAPCAALQTALDDDTVCRARDQSRLAARRSRAVASLRRGRGLDRRAWHSRSSSPADHVAC